MDPDCKVIVTGAAGFIGYHLSERLLSAGATVHGIDNLNSYYAPSLKKARLATKAAADALCRYERGPHTKE